MRGLWLSLALLFAPAILIELPDRSRAAIRVVLDALAACRLTSKDAYLTMQLTKSQWSRICAGDLHMPLERLALLPMAFQIEFVALYAAAVFRLAAEEITEDVQLSKGA